MWRAKAQLPDEVGTLLRLPEARAREIRVFFRRQGRRVAARLVLDLAVRLPARGLAAAVEFTRRFSLDSAPGQ